jgi:hypothetical protein
MQRNQRVLSIARSFAPLVLAFWLGCADDDTTTSSGDTAAGSGGESDRGGAGSKAAGGESGAAGKGAAGSGTKSDGAAGAKSDDGDKGDDDEGSAGKADQPAADGGKGGSSGGAGGVAGGAAAGAGGASSPPPDLSNASGLVIAGVNALSGVAFATDGTIYASGEINITDAGRATGDTAADKYRTSLVGHKLALVHVKADGALDEAFGDKGIVSWESPGGDATSMGVAQASDGSLVVAANVKYPSKRVGLALLKFDTAGKLVSSFGDNGRKDLILGWTDADVGDFPKAADGAAAFPAAQAWDIKPSDNGTKLVVFAHESAAHGQLNTGASPPVQRNDNDRYIIRVNASDGSFDPAFNGGKPVVVNTPNDGATGKMPPFPSDGARHGLIEADGSIVAAGYTNYGDDKGAFIVLIRLKPDGSFDEAFHKERPNQPVLPGVAVFNPVPEADKGFAECYGVAHTPGGYVTTGYGRANGLMNGLSSLGYVPSLAVDMVSTRFTGTAVDTTYGRGGVLAAQSEALAAGLVSVTEDRGRSSVIALADGRAVMGGRFGQYPALYVVATRGQFDDTIVGKVAGTDGMLLFPPLGSDKQPATSMFYGLTLSADGKRIAAGTNNHEHGALLALLDVKDDGLIEPVKAP